MNDREERERLVDRLDRRYDLGERVLDALRAVPRHEFLPEESRHAAYEDRPLPIAGGQTISAPHMVAMMTDALGLDAGDRVLEVGTGCGYHAAVTAEVAGPEHTYSVEYDDTLCARARENLDRTGYGAVSVRHGDGSDGWPAHAPYDAAYLTCAAPEFPAPLPEQVRRGGVLLAPIGTTTQRLVRATRTGDGLDTEDLGGVRFVSMQGDAGDP